MSEVVAYTALHYGSPYLSWAIRSIIDAIDFYYVLYAPTPSHGSGANGRTLPLSDSRYELQVLAYEAAGEKMQWIDGDWTVEGNQRDTIFDIASNAGIIIVLDYDEIWAPGAVQAAIDYAQRKGHYRYHIPMIHYWRSFHRAILHDPAYPIRLFNLSGEGEEYIHTRPINHMGYAIPTWLMDYKWRIHGHKSQFRADINWPAERWAVNAQKDCHPVGSEYWNPETINPMDYLPEFMQNHPYWSMEVIEG